MIRPRDILGLAVLAVTFYALLLIGHGAGF